MGRAGSKDDGLYRRVPRPAALDGKKRRWLPNTFGLLEDASGILDVPRRGGDRSGRRGAYLPDTFGLLEDAISERADCRPGGLAGRVLARLGLRAPS